MLRSFVAVWFWGLLSYLSFCLYRLGFPSKMGMISKKYTYALMTLDREIKKFQGEN